MFDYESQRSWSERGGSENSEGPGDGKPLADREAKDILLDALLRQGTKQDRLALLEGRGYVPVEILDGDQQTVTLRVAREIVRDIYL